MAETNQTDDIDNHQQTHHTSADVEAINLVLSTGAFPFLDVAGIARLRRPTEEGIEICWPI